MKSLCFALLGVFIAACGGTDDSTTTGASTVTAGSTSASNTSASSGAGGNTTASSSTGLIMTTSTGTGGADPNATTFTMTDFDVAEGEEVYKCQNFANPFGADVDIGEFDSDMTAGSHHLLLFYKANAVDGAEEDCSGLEFAATPYSTQQPQDGIAFPPGVAAHIPAGTGFRVQSHYLNTTGDTIHAHVTVTLHRVDSSTVTDHAGVIFLVQPDFAIPPQSTQDVTMDCTLPQDMKMLKTASHMHKHGTNFVSTIAGQDFYDTTIWNEPAPKFFSPPLQVHQGDALHFDCTFVNTSADTLTFGESAQTNEMCILSAMFYPIQGNEPTIGVGAGVDCH